MNFENQSKPSQELEETPENIKSISAKSGLLALALAGYLGSGYGGEPLKKETSEKKPNNTELTAKQKAESHLVDSISEPLKYTRADLIYILMLKNHPGELGNVLYLSSNVNFMQHWKDKSFQDRVENYRKEIDSLVSSLATPADYLVAEKKVDKLNQLLDLAKAEVGNLIQSEAYLKKLAKELDVEPSEAIFEQQVRLKNLAKLQCNFVRMIEINGDNPSRLAYYVSGTNQIYIPCDSELPEADLRGVIVHEILHEVTNGISLNTKKIFADSYLALPNDTVGDVNKYFSKPSERLVRKQALDMEMERLGIKKYEEKFTHKHFVKLMDAYKNGKIDGDAKQFIKTTKPKKLEKIINSIAQTENPDKVYYPEAWFKA